MNKKEILTDEDKKIIFEHLSQGKFNYSYSQSKQIIEPLLVKIKASINKKEVKEVI